MPQVVIASAMPASTTSWKRAASAGLAEPLAPRLAERASPESRSDWVVPLEARFTFDTFVVGKPNEFAHACARRVSEKPASPGFNPLFLYGFNEVRLVIDTMVGWVQGLIAQPSGGRPVPQVGWLGVVAVAAEQA